jgi:hypothetical protein
MIQRGCENGGRPYDCLVGSSQMAHSIKCPSCDSAAIDEEVYLEYRMNICADCGELICRECHQSIEIIDIDLRIRHTMELERPKCSIHKAENVQDRRAQMKVVR